ATRGYVPGWGKLSRAERTSEFGPIHSAASCWAEHFSTGVVAVRGVVRLCQRVVRRCHRSLQIGKGLATRRRLSQAEGATLIKSRSRQRQSHQLVDVQATWRLRRANARRTPHAKIRPGSPAPAMGPGTAAANGEGRSPWMESATDEGSLRVKVKLSNVNVLPKPKLLVKTALVMPKSEILRKIFGGRPVPAPTKFAAPVDTDPNSVVPRK